MTDEIASRLSSEEPTYILILGKKGTGKSVLARRFWDTWPGDELCIDPTKDALTTKDVDHSYDFVPDTWPPALREDEPVRIRYVPDKHSPTFRDDMDRAVGLVSKRRGSLLWVDEINIVNEVNRTGPYMRHLLIEGRHDRTSVVLCGPRCVGVDPLILAQSDVVYVFYLPSVKDRTRLAETCGIDKKLLDVEVADLANTHDYLRWDGNQLVRFPAIPIQRARPPRAR